MAANQTIINAAGQRYAPIKTDYSGYIQGLSSIATGLINKSKSVKENIAGLNKLKEGAQTDITPWGNMIKNHIDDPDVSIETKTANIQMLKKGTLKLEELQSKLGSMLAPDGQGLSNSIDGITANYLYSYAGGDFNQSFYVTEPVYDEDGNQTSTEQKEFNMNIIPDVRPGKGFSPLVIGPEGEYITMDEFENLLNVANPADGDEIIELLEKFPTMSGIKPYKDDTKPPESVFNTTRNQVKGQITRLFKSGTKDAQGNKISGDNVIKSFMFDSEVILPSGETQTFVKWYLNKPGLIPDELQEMYSETFRNNFSDLSGEEEKAMLNMLAQDLIKYDPNIQEDLMTYIDSIFELNR
tara:strand:+ start:125 stop:1186 length:1062 start_codon:yes stop_codon:yes gene_type:complete